MKVRIGVHRVSEINADGDCVKVRNVEAIYMHENYEEVTFVDRAE